MHFKKVTFTNTSGQLLSGRLELPIDQQPHNFAIFAHCFTCTKNLTAIRHISRALSTAGIGVLRFDFTGLGESEGDFANTNFSGNVEDLIAAADYLAEHHKAPSLLVGHSLGGAAVLFAAAKLASVQAVATVGAPSDPEHVQHLLKSDLKTIQEKGVAEVNVGGRSFQIKKQFLDDLKSNSLSEIMKTLRKALLILHSPQDRTVDIKNAELLYIAAHHPKSFVSLDGADHLLSKSEDAIYTGKVIAQWALRYLHLPEADVVQTNHDVVARLDADNGYTTQMKVGNHYLTADEPKSVGGADFGPNPYDFVSAGLSACTVMTLLMYARRKKWDVQAVEVHTSYAKDYAEDCANCEEDSSKIDTFRREIQLTGDLDEKQIARLLQIADRCPVHRTLNSETQIITQLI